MIKAKRNVFRLHPRGCGVRRESIQEGEETGFDEFMGDG
jgi:hypothetical protein